MHAPATSDLRLTPLHALHQSLQARMVPFAGHALPVQYPSGLLAEHRHTRRGASLFDVSHMGQILVQGPDAAAALERCMPCDLIGLPEQRQRYSLLLDAQGGIVDDLMCLHRPDGWLLVVNGARKAEDLAVLQAALADRHHVELLQDRALLALQGPQSENALKALVPGVEQLRFMDGRTFVWDGADLCITRSGYTGEDGFEISLPAGCAEVFARQLLAQPDVLPAGLGARNSLRLEAGLCLYGQDMDAGTTPVEAALEWAIPKVRRQGGARAGGFPGADRVLAQLAGTEALARRRVMLRALKRVPVREPATLHAVGAQAPAIGQVTSGLLSPSLDVPIAMGYVPPAMAGMGQPLQARVRDQWVPMEVVAAPLVPVHYRR